MQMKLPIVVKGCLVYVNIFLLGNLIWYVSYKINKCVQKIDCDEVDLHRWSFLSSIFLLRRFNVNGILKQKYLYHAEQHTSEMKSKNWLIITQVDKSIIKILTIFEWFSFHFDLFVCFFINPLQLV